jgi:PAS domain S-box-containing protein
MSLFSYAVGITVPIGIVLLAASWFISSSLLHTEVENELRDQIIERSSSEATRIHEKLGGLQQFAETLAGNGLIINSLIDTQGRENYLPLFFRSLTPPATNEATVFLVDYRGRKIIDSIKDSAVPELPLTSEFRKSLILETSGLIIIEPVFVHGFVEGAIVLHYPASTFKRLFESASIRHNFFLVNKNNIVTFSDNSALANTGRPVPVVSAEDWLQIRTEVPQSNLSVVVASSLKVAFKSLETIQRVQIIGLIVFMAISIGLVVLAVSIISRPLKKMATGISAIKNIGDMEQQLDTKGPREIADIASTFNRLSAWLSSTTVSRDYVDNILSSITEGIVTIDRDGKITTINSAVKQMFGYDHSQLIGQSIPFLLTNKGQEAYLTQLNDQQFGELEGRRLDGSTFPIEFVITALTSDEEKSTVCTMHDITQRKIIEQKIELQTQELEKTNSDLERFVFVASHDLKAPLRGIDSLVGWIVEDLEELDIVLPKDTEGNLRMLSGRVRRMENLLDGLLEYARLGNNNTEVESVDVRELVLNVVDLLSLPEGFRIEIPDKMPVFKTEKVSLEQVFRNLIGNAVKHHDLDNGLVVISVTKNDDLYHFSLEDDGAGIAPEFHDKIFIMFQTLKPRDQVEGSGMGLAMVKKEVDLHGGTVGVESVPGERGSKFHFSWKCSDEI